MAAKMQLAVGLDAGSSRTRCLICTLERDQIRCLSYGLAPSAGWTKGRVSDQEAVAESIRAAVTDAERGAQVSVEAVTIGVGGSSIRGMQSRGLYEFGRPREIDQDDLTYAVEMASDVILEHDRMILHALPQDFVLDGRAGFRKPHKGVCSRLEANVHIVTASVQEHHAVVAAAHLAHLAVEETVFEPMAAAYACVTQEERARGVAVIDLGLHSTGMVIYDGEKLVLACNIPVTSDHLTRDVAYMLKISYEDAESLKQQYGCAMLGLSSESSLIEIPSPGGRAPREARRSELIEILDARADQLFTFARTEIQRAGMDRNLLEGVLLTGGGALLPGMWDMAEKKLDSPACHGLPTGIGDWPEELNTPLWATATGLAMYSAKLKLYAAPQRRARGLMGLVLR
ncbi:MAG: cell division protein FtsA [Bryobacteraceae bacterium]